MKNLTGPNITLYFMRLSRVVLDTTYDLTRFTYLTMQVKSTASEANAKSQAVPIDDALKTKTITAFADRSTEWNTYCDTSGKILGSSESADFPFKVINHN